MGEIGPISGHEALIHRDDGSRLDPASHEEWDEWVSAGRLCQVTVPSSAYID